ncbi:MAG: response regulator [Vicinamibacteria bacterium]
MSGEALRILVLEDTPADAEIELRELRRAGLEVEALVVETRDGFLAALESFRPELVLSDYTLPGFDGMEAVSLAATRAPGIPVVIVTGSINEETAVACMRAGAADYVLKDRLGRLASAVRLALDRARQAREKEAADAGRQEAEARERRRAAELEALLAAIPIPVWIAHDPQARRITGNPAANRLMRVSAGDNVSLAGPASERSADYRVLRDGRPLPTEELPIQRAAAGETIRDLEDEVVLSDGTRLRLLVNATTLRDEAGQPRGAISAAVDITDLRRSEARLRQLFQAVEQSPASVLITDALGRIEYVNPKFSEATGFSFEEAIGQNPRILKSGESSPEEYRVLWDTITNGGTWRGEFHNRRKDGSLFWEAASISGIRDAEGRITHYVAVKEDVSQWKESQRTLEEARQELARAQKMEAIGRLAGGVAHDFNNLLGVIRGHSELLARALPPDDRNRGRIEQIQRATDRAADLAHQLLAFGRKQTLRVMVLQLEAVVLEAEQMLRRVIGEDVELRVEVEPGLPPVLADPLQIEQVLLNLTVNARDAMPEGGLLTFRVASAGAAHAGGRRVALSVADTGSGMDPETLSHIFEPFFTTKAVGKGTGLGLATVYGIVSQLGGEIEVFSTLGAGTTFRVSLPAVPGSTAVAAPAATREAAAGGGETVLVVEDEDGLRALIVELLDSLGYRVLEAGRGKDALDLVRRHDGPIELLLTDVVMPGQNGRELAEQVRGLRPGIRVVMMSGYATDALHAEKGVAPGTQLLSKPFSQADLAAALREALSAAG